MRWFSLSVLTLVLVVATAVGAKPLDKNFLRQVALTRSFMLGRPVQPVITPDGKHVLFLRSKARVAKMSLYEFDTGTKKTRELLTPEKLLKGAEEKLSAEEKARRERQRVTVGGFTKFQLSRDGTQLLVSLSGRLYVIARKDLAVKELKVGKGTLIDPRFSPEGKSISYVLDHDLHVLDLATQKESRVTKGGTEKKTNALAEFVAQEEMNRFTGYWWSPDSKFIAYEEADNADVEVWYVADPISPSQKPHASFYPRPGKKNTQVRLGIIPVTGGETVWVNWNTKKYPYLGAVNWHKTGGLTLVVQNRLQQEQLLLRVDPKTGKTATLLTETDSAWLNLNHEKPHWLDDGSFLWTANGTEGPELQLRGKTGKLIRVLAGHAQGFRRIVNVKDNKIIFSGGVDPTQIHLYRISTTAFQKPVALTKEPGVHSAVFSKKGDVYVLQAAPASNMPKTTVHKADGTLIDELPSVAEEPPMMPKHEFLKVGKHPGFWTVVVKPSDFDAAKSYPVIVHVYGGPTHQQVQAPLRGRLLDQWLADQGFIVVSIDNRGTPGRGRVWEKAVYRKFGSVPLDDQVAGLKALAEKVPQMDLKRVGIYGWSFGGYMSGLGVLRKPDVFKAGIAGAPVTEWLDYDTHYTERYLGVPEKDDAAYKEGSLLTYAKDLKRPLLLVHGTADDNVYFRHTLKLTTALFRAGKECEVLPLSGLTHLVPDPVVMERMYTRFTSFFTRHLGKPTGMEKKR